jgi:hypothetical protein
VATALSNQMKPGDLIDRIARIKKKIKSKAGSGNVSARNATD